MITLEAATLARSPSPLGILLRKDVGEDVRFRFGERGRAWVSR
jgi:hypothetical protein